MKKLSFYLFIATLLLSSNLFAQDWVSMMQDHNANVKDVRAAFYKWYATHKPTTKKDEDEDATNPGEEHEEDGNYMLFRRWEWLMQSRTYPTGVRPDPAVIEKDYQNYLVKQQTKKYRKPLATQATWTYAGNTTIPSGGDAGRINRVRVDPNNSSILYACAPSGGLWKSTNGGTSWSTTTDQLLGLGTSDVAIDPTNSNIMYLATGDGDGIDGAITTPSTIGILKSTDGGATWQQTGLHYTLQTSGPSLYTVNEIKINPTNTNIVVAATSFGMYYTNDGGITWTSGQGGNFKSVEFQPGNPSVVYATTATLGGSGAKYYRSTNGGQTFTAITLPSATSAGRMQVGVTPAAPADVYVLADNGSNYAFLGLWLSTDTGKTFTEQSTTPNLLGFSNGTGSDATQGQGWYTLSIAVSPTNANVVLVGGVNVWESTNGGKAWSKISNWTGFGSSYVHADIHSITFAPGSGSTVYCGDDGGVHKTTNVSSWSDISNGLEIAEQYCIGLSGSNANEWITGWQDNGTNLANGSWSEVIGGDGMICFIDQTNNNYMYGETYDGSFEASSNGGASFSNATGGLTETGPWATQWLQDPQNSATLFAGLNNVWKSTNRGSSWTKISSYASTSTTINAIAVAPSSDQYIYAAQAGSIYATYNGGSTWTNVTGNIASSAITSIAVDPNNPKRLWVTISGYAATYKVFESDSGGNTWTNISTNLPNLPVNTIAYAGGGIDAMYVGTDMGVYYRDTTNTGGEWVAYSTGLPNVIVSDLKIYAPTGMLRAATYGRGVWQIGLYQPSATPPVAKFYGFPTKLCVNNTVQFTDTSSNQPTSWNWTMTGASPSTSTLQNPSVTYATAGTYPVTLKVSNGSGADSVTHTSYITVNPNPPTPVVTQNDSLLTATPSNYPFYQWYKLTTLIPGANAYDYIVSAKGTYRVTMSDSNGCSATGSFNVVVVSGINEVSLNDYINLYPNPTTGNIQLVFDIPQNGTYAVKVSNVLGQTIYSDAMHLSGKTTKTLDLSGYSKGVYFLSVEGNGSKAVRKIVLY